MIIEEKGWIDIPKNFEKHSKSLFKASNGALIGYMETELIPKSKIVFNYKIKDKKNKFDINVISISCRDVSDDIFSF